MKKRGILNSDLNALISTLGHTDLFVVADCGLPIPEGIPVVDLALVFGVPTFPQVLAAVVEEVELEGLTYAEEMADSPALEWLDLLPEGLETTKVSHEELKAKCAEAKFVIRTGENTPYANVILRCGVPF